MAKSDLLKEAIADAKAVKETALANAKLALQEAFAPRIQSVLSAKLSEELEDDEMAMAGDEEMDAAAEPEMDMDMDMDMDMEEPEAVRVGLDLDLDGEYDIEGELGAADEEEMDMDMEAEPEMDMEAEPEMDMEAEDDLNLESIIAELEAGLDTEVDEVYEQEDDASVPTKDPNDQSIDELIEAILAEEEMDGGEENMGAPEDLAEEEMHDETDKKELEEAYRTVRHLKSVINEVNLLNAKLLYTNKLFRNFELNESQKMKVIENFDRASNTREAKLVFTTLAESFAKPRMVARAPKKNVVKESKSYASKAIRTTAPSKKTTQVLNEGFEYANRWKKLAGLI